MNACYQIVALLIPFWQINPIYCESCLASTPTVKEVENCPNTTIEWQRASDAKQCQKMLSHNCKSFVYHCLMNENEDAFLEVCAPNWWMSGFCPMFNTKEERVIDNFKLDCTSFKEGEKCPSRFISTDAYKYQKCYEHVRKKIENNTTTNIKTCKYGHTTSSGSESNVSLIVAIVIVALLTVLVIVLFILLLLARKQIKWNETADQDYNSTPRTGKVNQESLSSEDQEGTGNAGARKVQEDEPEDPKKERKSKDSKAEDFKGISNADEEETGTADTRKVNQKIVTPEDQGLTDTHSTNKGNQKPKDQEIAGTAGAVQLDKPEDHGDTGTPSTNKENQTIEKPKVTKKEKEAKDSKAENSKEQSEDHGDSGTPTNKENQKIEKPKVPNLKKERNQRDCKTQQSEEELEGEFESNECESNT
ncbi:uncharacterized protein LOC134236528 [Saccostrea cucullata]|uniref:uncharacterized protein LOC134236528 n=1 Tax=Saccostrea cuccullata TaxID=36930 RepID=UPI002ED5D729